MSSILETFYILFQTDAKRVQSEVEGADKAAVKLAGDLDKAGKAIPPGQAKEVDAALTDAGKSAKRLKDEAAKVPPETEKIGKHLDVANATAGRLGGEFTAMASKVGGVLAGLFSVAFVVDGIRDSFAEINAMSEQADRLGFQENVEGYNAINQVLEDYGGNADKAQRNLRTFADSVAQAFGDADSAAGKALKSIGVNTADANGDLKNTEDVFLDLAGALEKVGKAKQQAVLKDVGIKDPSLKELLTSGRQNVWERFSAERAKGLITNEQAEQVRRFKLAWDDTKDAVKGFFNTMAGDWSPALTNFAAGLETFVLWLREHKTLVQGFVIGLGVAFGVLAAVLWGSAIPAIVASGVAMLVAWWPVIAIVAAVTAAIAAFALAWEDIQAYLRGDPSLIGELIGKYAWLRKAIDLVKEGFAALVAAGKVIWPVIQQAAEEFFAFIEAAAPIVGQVFGVIFEIAAAAFRGIWAVAGPILSLLWDAIQLWGRINATVWRGIFAVASEVFNALAPIVLPVLQGIGQIVQWLGGVFATVAKGIWGEWGAMFGRFVERLQAVIGLVRQLMGFAEGVRGAVDKAIGGGGAGARGAARAGQAQLATAAASPLAAATPGAVAARQGAGAGNKSTTVTVGKVEVHTQATDADGMAKAAGGALSSQLRRTSAQNDDGVDR